MHVELVGSIAPLRERLAEVRLSGAIIGLVPTMGALHAGHARLIEQARRECQAVVVSIFVNPLQFDREDDLHRYPRSIEADHRLCHRLGVDLVFAPAVHEMYPHPPSCTVDVGPIGDRLCGRYRPGHFRAVATVVMKLFQIVGPDRAYFGEKDAQQLVIVRRLVVDFNIPATIVGVPTVREPDGLAISSRNALLTPSERASAPTLYRALSEAARQIHSGVKDAKVVKARAVAQVPENPSVRLEYLEVVNPEDLEPVQHIDGVVRVTGALWVGSTRLIDNILSGPPSG